MRFLITLITQIVWLAATLASPPLTITDSGYYLTTLDESGVPTLERVETIVDLRTGDQPTPPVPDEPDQPAPPPAGISADVAEWAAEVGQPKTAQKYALIFETVRDGVSEGKIETSEIFSVLKQSADGLIGDGWTEFRQRLGDYLVDQAQRGNLADKSQVVAMLERVRYGVAYSAIGGESITNDDAAEVISKVNEVIAGE